MYVYVASTDSTSAYPSNGPSSFTVQLSQPISVRGPQAYLGLQELAIDRRNLAMCSNGAEDILFYVLVSECSSAFVGTHTHPVVRLVSLKEFNPRSSLLRFSDVIYAPLKEHNISSLSIQIRRADDCCTEPPAELRHGTTTCSFHITTNPPRR